MAATKLPKPPPKEAKAIAGRAIAAGRKPKDMQAAVAETYARTQARQTAAAGAAKASARVGFGPAIAPKPAAAPTPIVETAAQQEYTTKTETARQNAAARAAQKAPGQLAVVPPSSAEPASGIQAQRTLNQRRMPPPPGRALGLRGFGSRFMGPPADATDAEKAAWTTWWNSRPKRGISTPVTPPTGGAS